MKRKTVAMMEIRNLGEFILMEMRKRELSARKFAEFVGVSHQTINKFLESGSKDVGYPSVDFLVKLANTTKTDICYLMALVSPESIKTASADPGTLIISQRIEQLPDPYREIIDDIITKHTS